jgi:SAM-dependent methyltransferase
MHVAAPMRPVFERLMAGLVGRGLLRKEGSRFEMTSDILRKRQIPPTRFCATSSRSNPGNLPEALLCVATAVSWVRYCAVKRTRCRFCSLGSAPSCSITFMAMVFSPVTGWRPSPRPWNTVARSLPEGRGLRILEIGAGTGGLASQVLPLLERGLHSYTFSDVSAAFFSGAAQKLAAFSEVEFKTFDLEKPAWNRNSTRRQFDFIIGTNVLHAVRDVRAALHNLHGLLAPGGSLIFMDTRRRNSGPRPFSA